MKKRIKKQARKIKRRIGKVVFDLSFLSDYSRYELTKWMFE